MAGVQGGRVVLLHTLIHTQVAHFRVANLKSQSIFYKSHSPSPVAVICIFCIQAFKLRIQNAY